MEPVPRVIFLLSCWHKYLPTPLAVYWNFPLILHFHSFTKCRLIEAVAQVNNIFIYLCSGMRTELTHTCSMLSSWGKSMFYPIMESDITTSYLCWIGSRCGVISPINTAWSLNNRHNTDHEFNLSLPHSPDCRIHWPLLFYPTYHICAEFRLVELGLIQGFDI